MSMRTAGSGEFPVSPPVMNHLCFSRIAWHVRDMRFVPPVWSFPLGIDDSWFHFALKRLVKGRY